MIHERHQKRSQKKLAGAYIQAAIGAYILSIARFLFFVSFVSFMVNPAFAEEHWATYRGNTERTGNIDGQGGPAHPKVLWAFASQDHFVASPVPGGDRLYLAGLGGFNVAHFYCFATDPKAGQRVLWSKSTPFLKLPVVSSPAFLEDKVVFGDGMHQTDGGALHCLRTEGGLPLWELPVPGTLVHLEGSPTIAGKRVYIGGGAAGVLCIDPEHVTLDGQDMDLPAIQKLLEQKWKDLVAKFEEDKKKDPDFAVPPNEDQLPKPAPRRIWQQGQDKWHVDAPVTVIGNRVLVASAFLEKEKLGDRALFCLEAGTGEIRWKAPLKINPWGGPSVAGNVIVVSGSTTGYDPKESKNARGELAAFDLDGKQLWHKEVPGGLVSCAALANGLAVVTATDGRVRAFDLANGERRWIYEGKAPFFAPAAVAGGLVFVGDLGGVIHAINLADGKPKWTLDLGDDPSVKAPGMVYGGPVIHGGRLFVATCNLEGSNGQKPTTVVCIGDK